jgi:uncharacterized protein YukE
MFDIDTGAVRHLAAQLTERAAEIRAVAADLARQVTAVPWEGRAADAMRELAGLRLAALARVADLHDDAAEALDRHADAVDATLRLIATVESTVEQTADHAVDSVVDHTIGLLR